MHYHLLVITDKSLDAEMAPFGDDNSAYACNLSVVSDEDKQHLIDKYNKIDSTNYESFDELYELKKTTLDFCDVKKCLDGNYRVIMPAYTNYLYDWYELGGRWENYLLVKRDDEQGNLAVNEAVAKDIINLGRFVPYGIIKYGEYICTEDMPNEEFTKLLKDIPEDYMIYNVDIHG